MVQGYERREAVQDPNANRPVMPIDSVPLSPVQSPRPSSFSRVGEQERELAQALGKTTLGFEKYMEKKADQWRVEGHLAYAEGKTEAEITASGNRFTVEGYKAMETRTLFNQWSVQAGADIEDSDHQLSPEEYRKKLSDGFSNFMNQVGDDDTVRQMAAAMAEKTFPDLVSKQIIANNKYREEKTAQNYIGMVVSEAAGTDMNNPESVQNLKELLANEVSGLSPEKHAEALGQAFSVAKERGDNSADILMNTFGIDEKTKIAGLEQSAGIPSGLLGAVLAVESGGKRYGKDGKLLTSPKGAKGEMQVMDATNLDPGFGVTPAKDDSPEERARVGVDYLGAMVARYNGDPILGAMAYNSGAGNVDAALAKNGDPRTGTISYDDFVEKYPLAETRDYVKKINANLIGARKGQMTTEAAAVNQMLKAGFKPKVIEGILNDWKQHNTQKSNQFDKQRALDEQAVLTDAKQNGNYSKSLDAIEQMKNERGYSDAWANGMAGKALTKVQEWEKEYGQTVELQNAISNNRVSVLSSEKQQKAIELQKAEISAKVDADGNLSDQDKQQAKRQQVAEFLVNNNVVDKKWAAGIEGTLSGNILNKDGSVKKEALAAYDDYLLLSRLANPGYAAKYLGDSKDLVALAESYDGGGGLSTGQALQTAQEILSRKSQGAEFTPAPINKEQLNSIAGDMVNDLESWFSPFGGNHGTGWLQLWDYELDQAKRNPILTSMLADSAMRQKLRNPNLPDSAAMVLARNDVQSRTEFVLGNVVVAGKDSNIRKDMGLSGAATPTAVNEAFIVYMREYGKDIFGSAFDQGQILGHGGNGEWNSWSDNPIGRGLRGIPNAVGNTLMDAYRGVPAMLVTYDSGRKGFIVDLYANKERTQLRNAPHFIPAAEIGNYAIKKIYEPN